MYMPLCVNIIINYLNAVVQRKLSGLTTVPVENKPKHLQMTLHAK